MKGLELLAVGIRLIGFICILKAAKGLSEAFSSYSQFSIQIPGESPALLILGYVFTTLVLLVLALIFIKFPLSISRKLMPVSDIDEPMINGSMQDFQLSCFTILGVYILSWSIPDFIHNACLIIFLSDQDGYKHIERPYDIINQVVTVFEISIGLYLTLKARGLLNLIQTLRQVGAK